MKIPTQITYGVRALRAIAHSSEDNPCRVNVFCEEEKLPPKYVEQIFQKFRKAGIIKSVRGPLGGYYLAKKPDEVKVGDVIRIIEGRAIQLDSYTEREDFKKQRKKFPDALREVGLTIADGGERYNKNGGEAIKQASQKIWQEASRLLMDYFDSITIGSLK